MTQAATASRTRSTASATLSHVRNLLRWFQWEGLIGKDLARLVGPFLLWKEGGPPLPALVGQELTASEVRG